MRRSAVVAAISLLAVAPLWAQTPSPDSSHLGPRTLLPAHVLCTDLPVSAQPAPTVTIKGAYSPDGHEAMVKGDVAVLSAGTDHDLAVGQRFLIRRMQGKADPFAKKNEGFSPVRTAGWLSIMAVNETTALATLDHTCDVVQPGDYIEAYEEPVLPPSASPLVAPEFDDRAKVLFGTDRRVSFANGDLLSIDRGTSQGVTAGARYAIYRDRHNGLPLIYIGDAVVIQPEELTSKIVLVMVKDAVSTDDVAIPRKTK